MTREEEANECSGDRDVAAVRALRPTDRRRSHRGAASGDDLHRVREPAQAPLAGSDLLLTARRGSAAAAGLPLLPAVTLRPHCGVSGRLRSAAHVSSIRISLRQAGVEIL